MRVEPQATSKLLHLSHSHIKGKSIFNAYWADMPYVSWALIILDPETWKLLFEDWRLLQEDWGSLLEDWRLLLKDQGLLPDTSPWGLTFRATAHVSSLSDRCKVAKLCHMYKLEYQLSDCQNAPVVPIPSSYSRCRNPIQLQRLTTHSIQFQSFYPHTISLWSNLIVNNNSLTSIHGFKHSIM